MTFVVEALKRQHRDALANAQKFREFAATRSTKEEVELYLQQAQHEEEKASGYLRQSQTLAEIGTSG